MKHIFPFLIFITLLYGCTKSSNEVSVTAEKSTQECHMCPGYLIIKRGGIVDTLKRGAWGRPSVFNQFQYKNKDFLALPFEYFSRGIVESSISIISLNKENYLIPVFDTIISDNTIGRLEIIKKELTFMSPDSLLIQQYKLVYNDLDESVQKVDSVKELVIINLFK